VSIAVRDKHGTYGQMRRSAGPPLDRRSARYFAVVANSWSRGFQTRRDAQTAEDEMKGRVRQGVDVGGGRAKFAEFVGRAWWPNVEAKVARGQLKPTTAASYRMILDVYLLPSLGSASLRTIRPEDIRRVYRDLAHTRHLSSKSLKNAHGVLSNVLSMAVSDGLIAHNAAKAADVAPKGSSPRMKTWKAADLSQFLATVRDDRLYAAWRLLATTGMRRGELLALRWSDIDFKTRRLRIERALVVVNHTVHWSSPKTEAGIRTLDLDRTTATDLRNHRVRQDRERLASMGAWPADHHPEANLIFTDEAGGALRPEWFSRHFKEHVARASLPAIRLHDLRHTVATLMLRAGVPVHVVSGHLGHAKTSITMDIYAHVLDDQRSDATDQIASLIDGI